MKTPMILRVADVPGAERDPPLYFPMRKMRRLEKIGDTEPKLVLLGALVRYRAGLARRQA